MLRIEGLTKKFGETLAVHNVSFEVKSGEIFTLVGPNGSGKTTIIKTVVGLLRPTKGKVWVDGDEVSVNPLETKSKVGYIPDDPNVWSALTGEEFLHFVGALYNLEESKRLSRIPGLLSIFGLRGIEKHYFEDYSRGNKQKFAILAAFLHNPKLLLVDEPIVGLDPMSSDVAKKKFVEFAKSGGALLLATHTLSVAQEISTRIGVLKEGKLIAAGKLSELRTKAGVGSRASIEDVYMALVG